MNYATYDQLANDYKAGDRKWRPITEDYAEHMLNVVPPVRMSFGAYVCSEPYTHNNDGRGVYFCCRSIKGTNYAVMGTIQEWDSRSLLQLKTDKMLTRQDVVNHRDSGDCPYCGGADLNWDNLEAENRDVYQQVTCLVPGCGERWTNVYHFVSIVQEREMDATVYVSDDAERLTT